MRLTIPAAMVCIAAVVGSDSRAEAGQRHKWWESGEIRTQLNITDEQAAAIDEIYMEAVPVLRSLGKTLDGEEAELSRLIADMTAPEWELTLQIDKTEAARSALSKQRTLMIYHMRQELTPKQRLRLREIQDLQREQRRSTSRR